MIPSSLLNLNHDVLAAVDVETTGLLCGFHEIIQIAIVPLNSEIQPSETLRPFYINIRPEHPERQRGALGVHGIKVDELANSAVSQSKAADLLDEWFVKLDLPYKKRLCPLAHNYPFERGFLTHWLGLDTFDALFHPYSRDTMALATTINDAAAWHGRECPFKRLSLGSLCEVFGIDIINAHDALSDALACAALYRAMIKSFGRK
jgi:DNA polymerase III epsilon subunit-like protein